MKSSEMRIFFAYVARVEFLMRSHSVSASVALYKCHTERKRISTNSNIYRNMYGIWPIYTDVCHALDQNKEKNKQNNNRNSYYIYCFHQVVSWAIAEI